MEPERPTTPRDAQAARTGSLAKPSPEAMEKITARLELLKGLCRRGRELHRDLATIVYMTRALWRGRLHCPMQTIVMSIRQPSGGARKLAMGPAVGWVGHRQFLFNWVGEIRRLGGGAKLLDITAEVAVVVEGVLLLHREVFGDGPHDGQIAHIHTTAGLRVMDQDERVAEAKRERRARSAEASARHRAVRERVDERMKAAEDAAKEPAEALGK